MRSLRSDSSESKKSHSDLELKELKGFMDMGFVFTEEARSDSNLASIVPALTRLGKVEDNHYDHEIDESGISRPYFSESWDDQLKKKKGNPVLIIWKLPSLDNETDMKHSLRAWAHTVASIVR